jgi:TonB-dependent starch-binding outer membrane protein SusC
MSPAFRLTARSLACGLVVSFAILAGAGVAEAQEPAAPVADSIRSRTSNTVTGYDVFVIYPDSLPDIPRTMSELLAARVPGMFVQRSSGAAGAASWISIRDAAAIRGYAPLVIVDGVERVPAIEPLGGFSRVRLGVSGIDDIPVESVERIEVLRGPAAAARYGRDAGGGVILVSTRSSAGRVRAHVRITGGFADENADFPRNYETLDANGARCLLYYERAGGCIPTSTNTYSVLRDRNPFRTGTRRGAQADAAGTLGASGYALGALHERADGVLPMDGTDRSSMTIRLLVPLADRFRFSFAGQASLRGFSQPSQSDSYTDVLAGGIAARPIDCSQQTPCGLDTTSHGYYNGATPGYVAQLGDHYRSQHFSPGAFLDIDATSWLALHTIATVDADRTQGKRVTPVAPFYPYYASNEDATTNVRRRTLEQRATASWTARSFDARTTLALRDDVDWIKGKTSVLAAYQGGSASANYRFRLEDHRTSIRLEQRLSAGDIVSLGGGALYTHPRLEDVDRSTRSTIDGYGDLSIGVLGEPRARAAIPSLRLRAAAGQVSGYDSRTILTAVFTTVCTVFPCPEPEPTPLIANRALELEAGVDVGFRPNNTRLSFTAFRRTEKDPIFQVPAPPSPGYSTADAILRRRVTGAELSASTTLVDVASLHWDAMAFFAVNRNRVTRLGAGSLFIGGASGTYAIVGAGKPFAEWWRDSYSWSDANGDGAIGPGEITPAYQPASAGSSRPTRQAALQSSVTIRRAVTLAANVDYVGGHKVLNVAEAVQCRMFQCAAFYVPSTSLSEQARAMAVFFGPNYQGFLESGTTVRLRELSASFHSPNLAAFAHAGSLSLTLAARNLATWTRYGGLDPEIDAMPPGIAHLPGGIYLPNTRQFTARFTLTY